MCLAYQLMLCRAKLLRQNAVIVNFSRCCLDSVDKTRRLGLKIVFRHGDFWVSFAYAESGQSITSYSTFSGPNFSLIREKSTVLECYGSTRFYSRWLRQFTCDIQLFRERLSGKCARDNPER